MKAECEKAPISFSLRFSHAESELMQNLLKKTGNF